MRCTVLDFEMFHGASSFGDIERGLYEKPEDLHQNVLGRYASWLDPEEIHDLTGTAGIFVRQSYEHGALWFAVPDHIHSFHIYDGLVFSVQGPVPTCGQRKSGPDGRYEVGLHPAFHILTGTSTGIRTVPEALMDNVIRTFTPVASAGGPEMAIEAGRDEITRRFSLRDELSDPWLGSI